MFSVEWLQTALNDLTNVWLSADSSTRHAVTAAATQIEQLLKTDPQYAVMRDFGGMTVLGACGSRNRLIANPCRRPG